MSKARFLLTLMIGVGGLATVASRALLAQGQSEASARDSESGDGSEPGDFRWPSIPGFGAKSDDGDSPGGFLGPGPDRPEDAGAGDDDAEEQQRKVIELRRLALQNFENGRINEAIRFINDLISVKPYEAEYHFALGLCYRKEMKYKDSLKKYQDVLDLGGPRALISLLKAEVYAAEGSIDKAYESLRKAAVGGRNIIGDVQNLPILETFKDDTEFIKLALQLERFEVRRGRRHDPFTNLFPPAGRVPVSPDGVMPPGGDGLLSKAEQEKVLREAVRLKERIVFYIQLQDNVRAMDSYIKLKDMIAQKKQITVPMFVKKFDRIIAELPDIEVLIEGIRLKYYYNQAVQKLGSMRDVFEDSDYGTVEKFHADLENLAREMVMINRQYEGVANEILERSRRWVDRARVRREFEQQRPDIQGIIISGDSKLAILNEKVVRQGEHLDNMRVVKIESNRVTFRYKGEEIPMVFRRY